MKEIIEYIECSDEQIRSFTNAGAMLCALFGDRLAPVVDPRLIQREATYLVFQYLHATHQLSDSEERRFGLHQLTRLSEQMGLYDDEFLSRPNPLIKDSEPE